jgi:hypothetical protein
METQTTIEMVPKPASTYSTKTQSTRVQKPFFAFLGDGRFATFLVSGITMVGIFIFLSIPQYHKGDTGISEDIIILGYVLTGYYIFSVAFIIFGIVSIAQVFIINPV